MEDNELNRLCNEIYKKHGKALDLIYNHSDMGMNPTMRVLTEVLKEYAEEGRIDYDPKDRIAFHTQKMTDFLHKLNKPESSWSSYYPYRYWFKIDDEQISFVFEIGYWGLDDETKEKIEALVKTRNPKNKKESGRYKRVETFKWVRLDEYDDEKRKTIKGIINDVLKKEPSWIKECEDYIKDCNCKKNSPLGTTNPESENSSVLSNEHHIN